MTNNVNNIYPLLGAFTVIPSADLASATAPINAAGNTRKGKESVGKKAGMTVLTLTTGSPNVYKLYVALGPLPTDTWQLVDGSAQVIPS